MKTKATMPNGLPFQPNTPVGYVPRSCKWCGDIFHAKPADVKRGWALYCSKSCKGKAQVSRAKLPSAKPKIKVREVRSESFSEWDRIAMLEDKQNANRRRG